MHIATISSQRQITLPQRMLALLKVDAMDKLLIRVKAGKLVAEPMKSSLVAETSGSLLHLVPPEKRGKSLKEIDEYVRKKVAAELAHE